MIELKEERLEGTYIYPDGEPRGFVTLLRTDPVTGSTVRITGRRPMDPASVERELPDLAGRVALTQKDCPFCEGNVERMTPQFLPEIVAEGRIRRGAAWVFPNLMPYGRHSAVCLFSLDHHIPLGEFTHRQFADALQACCEYLDAVRGFDPESCFQVITQNVLPASGGALLHPHLQVNVDPVAMTYHRYLLRHDAAFLEELAAVELAGPRFIRAAGRWVFFAAFAPLAAWEVHAVCRRRSRFSELTAEDVSDFVSGVLDIHAFYRADAKNSANMGIFGTTDGRHALFARVMARSTWRPWYRSDRSAY